MRATRWGYSDTTIDWGKILLVSPVINFLLINNYKKHVKLYVNLYVPTWYCELGEWCDMWSGGWVKSRNYGTVCVGVV